MSQKFKSTELEIAELSIGTWRRHSTPACKLVARFYFGRRQLNWEIVNAGNTTKMMISWDLIRRLKVEKDNTYLEILLFNPPVFKSMTLNNAKWSDTTDFTCGVASTNLTHKLRFASGVLSCELEKVFRSDSRLLSLSRQRSVSPNMPNYQEQNSLGPSSSVQQRPRVLSSNLDHISALPVQQRSQGLSSARPHISALQQSSQGPSSDLFHSRVLQQSSQGPRRAMPHISALQQSTQGQSSATPLISAVQQSSQGQSSALPHVSAVQQSSQGLSSVLLQSSAVQHSSRGPSSNMHQISQDPSSATPLISAVQQSTQGPSFRTNFPNGEYHYLGAVRSREDDHRVELNVIDLIRLLEKANANTNGDFNVCIQVATSGTQGVVDGGNLNRTQDGGTRNSGLDLNQ